MGDISVIARRLSEKNVQYGWSGNAGYPETVGARLWSYYNTPEMVEYLFSLGQLRQLCAPGGETSDDILPGTFRTEPTGRPHWVTTSELDIYSRIAFVDHAYLYDSDNTWYYIAPLIMHTKIPLDTTLKHTDHGVLDLEFRLRIERIIFKTVQQKWFQGNMEYREYATKMGYDDSRISEIGKTIERADDDSCLYENYKLLEDLRKLYHFFDPWSVVKMDECRERIDSIILRPRSSQHIETINWSE